MPALIEPSSNIRPQRVQGQPTEEGDFVVFEHVCLFDSHVGDDGVHYDERLLRKIADNCNRRIKSTGDWCPVVVGHTRDSKDKRAVDDEPDVIGLAGPFYVGDWVNADSQRAKAVFATFWIFPEHEQTFLRHPRRSVEIWPEERPEDRFFDPVSCLGAETPKRDLGMIYSRSPRNIQCYSVNGPLRYAKRYRADLPIKYEAAAPSSVAGPNTTFIPGPVQKKRPGQNEKGAPRMFSPEDLQQLAESLKPMIQAMIDNSVIPVETSEPSTIEEAVAEPIAAGPVAPAGPVGAMPPATPPPVGDIPVAEPAAPAEPFAGAETPAEEAAEEGQEPNGFDELEDEDQNYAKALGRKYLKYAKDDDTGRDGFMGTLDDDDKGKLGKFMKYACNCPDTKMKYAERYEKDVKEGEADKYGKPTDSERPDIDKTILYAKPSDDISPDKAKQILEDGEAHGKPLTDAQKGMFGAAAGKQRNAREDTAIKYRKLLADHEEIKQRLVKAEEELGQSRVKERYAKRFATLKDLEVEGYCFNPEEEMELTEDLTEDQFNRHVQVIIPQRYSRVSDRLLPTEREKPLAALAKEGEPQKYAKQASQVVFRLRNSGHDMPYKRVLEHLITRKGELDEPALLVEGNGKAK